MTVSGELAGGETHAQEPWDQMGTEDPVGWRRKLHAGTGMKGSREPLALVTLLVILQGERMSYGDRGLRSSFPRINHIHLCAKAGFWACF